MADSRLKIDIRRSRIMEYLRRDGKVLVSQLSRDLGATPVTIRSDLSALERDGYLIRIQGGALRATAAPPSAAGTGRGQVAHAEEKQAIAAAVSAMISDGDTIFINSGTTTQFVASALHAHLHLKVVTNSLAVAMDLGTVPTFQVLLLGGGINTQYGFLSGTDAQAQLQRYQADWAILSVDGCSAEGGLTTYHAEEALLNATMIQRAKRTLIVADHSKIGRTGFAHICEVGPSLTLVTDSRCSEEQTRRLTECGLAVTTA